VFLTDEGCLLRKADSGENHTLMVFFLRENGLKYTLCRRRAGPDTSIHIPDLFETGEATMEQKDTSRPSFLKEFTPHQHFPEIARHYKTFKAASLLAQFYEKNLYHMEHFSAAWDLLQTALGSFAAKHQPEATQLKALFVFARLEGYPVQAQWLGSKKPAERASLSALLSKPVGVEAIDHVKAGEWIQDLNRFFQRETDLLPADGSGPS
jgi:hypothetical protein